MCGGWKLSGGGDFNPGVFLIRDVVILVFVFAMAIEYFLLMDRVW